MITEDVIKNNLGEKYNPKAEYIVEHVHYAIPRVACGECNMVGELKTETEGIMIILERNPKPKPVTAKEGVGIERKKTK